MKSYACDKCGAEFAVEKDSFDDVCPECFSDRTVLLSSDDEDYFDDDSEDDFSTDDFDDFDDE